MNINEWRKDPKNAAELAAILDNPILKAAIAILDSQTMAKTIGGTQALFQSSNNAHILFGWDAGRASVFSDLANLATTPDEVTQIEPTYTSYQGEF